MSNTATARAPFNIAQLEIMQLFAEGVNDKELVLLRQLLIDFKFSRVTALADKILDEKGWSAKDLAKNALKEARTPYRSKKKLLKAHPLSI